MFVVLTESIKWCLVRKGWSITNKRSGDDGRDSRRKWLKCVIHDYCAYCKNSFWNLLLVHSICLLKLSSQQLPSIHSSNHHLPSPMLQRRLVYCTCTHITLLHILLYYPLSVASVYWNWAAIDRPAFTRAAIIPPTQFYREGLTYC